VAWTEPLERLIVPNVPFTPGAVVGPFTRGQFCAHVPLHLDIVDVSGANEYNVKPLALVSTVAPPIFAVFRLPAAAGTPPLLAPEYEGPEGVPDEPHAASAAAAATAADSTSSIRKRFDRC
jgi:hypothetical protein